MNERQRKEKLELQYDYSVFYPKSWGWDKVREWMKARNIPAHKVVANWLHGCQIEVSFVH